MNDVLNTLLSKLQNDTLTLDKDTLGISGFKKILKETFDQDSITFIEVKQIDLNNNVIEFNGKTTLHRSPNYATVVKIFKVSNKLQMTFTADIMSNWSFTPSNPNLPSDIVAPPSSHPALITLSNQLTTESPCLSFSTYQHQDTSTHFAHKVGLSLLWYKQSNSLAGAPVILDNGRLVCSVDVPGQLGVGHFSLSDMTVTHRCNLYSNLTAAYLQVSAKLKLGSKSLDMIGAIDVANFDLDLHGKFSGVSINNFAALKDLLGITNLGTSLPTPLKSAPGLTIKQISTKLNPLDLSVKDTALTVTTTKTWDLIPGLFSMETLALRVAVKSPFAASEREIRIIVDGVIKLIGKDVAVQASFPDFVVSGKLLPDQTLELKDLLQTFAPGVSLQLPNLTVTRLALRIDPQQQTYMLAAGVENHWDIDLGISTLKFEQLNCEWMVSNGVVSGMINGVVKLAGVTLFGQAILPDYRLSAQLYDGNQISMQQLLTNLLPASITLPATLPDIAIWRPSFNISVKDQEFTVVGTVKELLSVSLSTKTLDIESIDVEISRKKNSSAHAVTTYAVVAELNGKFKLLGLSFNTEIKKDGINNNWTFKATVAQTTKKNLVDLVNEFLPGGVALPSEILNVKVNHAAISYDMAATALTVITQTSSRVQFPGIGSVAADTVEFAIKKRSVSSAKYDWRIKIKGTLKIGAKFEIAGSLDFYDDETGAGFAFIPSSTSPLNLPLPLPKYNNNFVSLGISFGALSIVQTGGQTSFSANLTVAFNNIPDFFDNIIADQTVGTFYADNNQIKLTVDRLIEGIEIELPTIPVSSSQSIDLGKMRFDITDFTLLIGDDIEASAKFGIGLPQKLNNVFGVKANGSPEYEFFNTYDPNQPTTTLVSSLFAAGTNGVTFTIVDSPLKCIVITQRGNEAWVECDFGPSGAVEFMVPTFSLDVESSSFKAKGSATVVRPLRLPLTLLKNLLRQQEQDELAELLPDAVPLMELKLLDANNNINLNKLYSFLENANGPGVSIPQELKTAFNVVKNKFNKLPDRLRQYFNIALPDGLDFDISVTPDGSATIDVSTKGAPIKALAWVPYQPSLIGFEFKGFSFGEILSGQLFLIKLDLRVDYFDMYGFAGALLPTDQLTFLADSRSLQQTFIIDKLTMLIFYQTSYPIPIPLFYDQIGIEYRGIEDLEFQTHIKFPMPQLNPMEIIRVIGELQQFFTDETYKLDPSNPPQNTDLKFTLGANYIELPGYLGGGLLGKKTDLATISLYQSVAIMLNGIKFFSIEKLLKTMPLQDRTGSQTINFFNNPFDADWLVTTATEFQQSTFQQARIPASNVNEVIELIPKQPSGKQDGMVLILNGKGKIANKIDTSGVYALSLLKGHGVATGFDIQAQLANNLFTVQCSGMVKVNKTSSTPFTLNGISSLTMLNTEVMNGQVGFGKDGLSLSGMVDLLPGQRIVIIKGQVSGFVNKKAFSLKGRVDYIIGRYLTMSGAEFELTHNKATVSGTYLNQSLVLGIEKLGLGIRFSGGLSPIKAGAAFAITGPSTKGGPNMVIDLHPHQEPRCELRGKAKLLGITNNTTVTILRNGFKFDIVGKLFDAYKTHLIVTTPNNILDTNKFTIEGTLQNDFNTAANKTIKAGLKKIADDANKVLNAAQKKLDQANAALNTVIKQIADKIKQLESQLKTQKQQAQTQVTQAQTAVQAQQNNLNSVKSQVNSDKSAAIKTMNDAQDVVDGLKDDIDKLNKQIKSKQKALNKCQPYEVTKIAQLTAEISVKSAEKISKETAKTTATTALNVAKAAVTQATATASQAINAASQLVDNANTALDNANQQLQQIQNQLLNIANHASLNALKTLKAAKETAINKAQADLNTVKRTQAKALGLASFIRQYGLTKSFVVNSATFKGKHSTIKSGKVNLSVTFSLMQKPKTTVVVFDLKNPSAGFAKLLTTIKTLT